MEQPLEVEQKFFCKHSWNNSFMSIGNIPNPKLPVIVLLQTSTFHSSGYLLHPWNTNYTVYPCEYNIHETDMHCSDTTNHQLNEPKWLICKHYWNNIIDYILKSKKQDKDSPALRAASLRPHDRLISFSSYSLTVPKNPQLLRATFADAVCLFHRCGQKRHTTTAS